jgi:TolB-like protein
MSGDLEQEYFADGITQDITTALSRLRWLFVIAQLDLHLQGESRRRSAGRPGAGGPLCPRRQRQDLG